jgi:GNAT superfamily N-acetyltransferase
MASQSGESVSAESRLSIQPFGGAHPDRSKLLRELHETLLGHSPVVMLGPDFMERIYYTLLPEMDLVFGAVAWVDGEAAGFIAITEDSDNFMGEAIRHKWYLVAWVLMTSILRDPRRILGVWDTLKIMSGRQAPRAALPVAELLSFGVLEKFRRAAFVRNSGLKVGRVLYDYAIEELARRGCTSAKVLVDTENRDTRMMYSALGWQVTNPDVPGWRAPQVEFQKELAT